MDLSPLLSKILRQQQQQQRRNPLSFASLSCLSHRLTHNHKFVAAFARSSALDLTPQLTSLNDPAKPFSYLKHRLSDLFNRFQRDHSGSSKALPLSSDPNNNTSNPIATLSSASVLTSFIETTTNFSMEAWQIFLIAFGSYLTASVFFHFFPTLIHKKKNVFTARNISHRGGAGERPENTLAAFHHAIAVGSEMLELDVYLTSDGHVVVNHDRVLTRTTGHSLDVTAVNYEELPRLLDSMILPPPFHASDPPSSLQWNKERPQDDLTHIPLLDEVFKEFPNTPINIDCKVDSAELCQKVNELVVKHNRAHLTCWGAFSDVNCQRLYKLNPTVPMLFSFKRIAILYLSYIFGVLPFVPLKESFYEMPLITPKLEALFRQYNRSYRGWKVEAALSIYKFLSTRTSLITHLQRRGIRVFFWVLNHEEDWEIAFRLGADGVMTDFPTRLSRFLKNYNHSDRKSHRASSQDRLLRN